MSHTTAINPPAAATGSLSIAAHAFEAVIANYPDESAEILRFWFFLAKDRGWSLSKLQDATGLSTTTLSRIFRGAYEAGIENAINTLRKARENFAEAVDNPDFIETSLSTRLFATYDTCRALGNVSILRGAMGIGKTECATEYQRRNNHGRTMIVRFPAGASFAYFVSHVARSVGVSTRSQSAFQQREKIIAVLSAGKRLLIIDELHQAFLTTRTDTAVKCCEFLREIADVAKCGLALMGTELLQKEFFHGQHRDALRQLVDRGTVQIGLPSKPTKKDIAAFLKNYGLHFPSAEEPEAGQILSDVIASSGLRKLTMHLRDGASYAAKRGESYQWSHFIAAFEAIQALSK
jgi:DNA transposition AAA+ family ATPase